MKTSANGIKAIKLSEGTKLKAYDDGGGVWTIATGTIQYPNGTPVKKGDVITQAQADQYLAFDLKRIEDDVNRLVKVPLTQNQFDALVSFTFNLGIKNLSESKLLKKLNAGDYAGASNEFPKWKKSPNPDLEDSLKARRIREQKLFNT
jgi:lysozyme